MMSLCVSSVFKDSNTPSPFIEDLSLFGDDGRSAAASKPDHIYMDCMGYGMGCSCLQMTFQACNITEARYLYDQLTPLCPIMVCYITTQISLWIRSFVIISNHISYCMDLTHVLSGYMCLFLACSECSKPYTSRLYSRYRLPLEHYRSLRRLQNSRRERTGAIEEWSLCHQ